MKPWIPSPIRIWLSLIITIGIALSFLAPAPALPPVNPSPAAPSSEIDTAVFGVG